MTPTDLRRLWARADAAQQAADTARAEAIRAALDVCGGRVLAAADALDVPRGTLRRIMARLADLDAYAAQLRADHDYFGGHPRADAPRPGVTEVAHVVQKGRHRAPKSAPRTG